MIVEEKGMRMTRREDIADAGVGLIAASGVRALTHRAVDAAASLPPGSTSYYARTRRDLVSLVVDRLAEYTQEDLDGFAVPGGIAEAEAVQLASAFLDQLARREDAQAVRFALLFELRGDPALRAMLTADAPVRAHLITVAESVLEAIGVRGPTLHAPDFVGLMDALLMYRTSGAAPVNASRVLGAYLRGLDRVRQ
jgi:AcrR family transcriptional regulator